MKHALPKYVTRFSKSYGSIWKAFQHLGEACHAAGPLDPRARRLIKLGIAAAAQSEGALHSAVRAAMRERIPPAEIRHAILLAITTIGFPRAMAALSWAEDVMGKK